MDPWDSEELARIIHEASGPGNSDRLRPKISAVGGTMAGNLSYGRVPRRRWASILPTIQTDGISAEAIRAQDSTLRHHFEIVDEGLSGVSGAAVACEAEPQVSPGVILTQVEHQPSDRTDQLPRNLEEVKLDT